MRGLDGGLKMHNPNAPDTGGGSPAPQSDLPAADLRLNFAAPHAAMGARFALTCGRLGSRASLDSGGAPIASKPDLYVGVKRGPRAGGDASLACLPFFESHTEPGVVALNADRVQRTFGWATDRWNCDDFEFTIYTPFGGIVDPPTSHPSMSRVCLLPAVLATLTVDNTHGDDVKTGVFAIRSDAPGATMLPDQHGWRGKRRAGFALGRSIGIQGMLESEPTYNGHDAPLHAFQGVSLAEAVAADEPCAVHRVGDRCGIAFEVPAGQKRALVIAIGSYLDGVVTSGVEGRFLYTKYFSSLTDVFDHALRAADAIRNGSAELDRQLADSGLSAHQQFLIAHATRGYYANTQLLDVAGEATWVVHGDVAHAMNALDCAADQVFWELDQNPWTVRNVLDHFARRYSYHDDVKVPVVREEVAQNATARRKESGSVAAAVAMAPPSSSQTRRDEFDRLSGGISFCHDMGVAGAFAPPGTSAFEQPERSDRFSFSTSEQLCNWILMAASYVAKTGDAQWVGRQRDVILACVRSMLNRESGTIDDAGAVKYDSARCGETGREVTTYDALGPSLAPARDSLYLAVKRVAAYLGLEFLLGQLGETGGEEAAANAARRAAEAIGRRLNAETGYIPASFDDQNPARDARVLAAIEPLVFPWYWGTCEYAAEHKASHNWFGVGNDSLVGKLKRHAMAMLADPQRRNVAPDGRLKLTSASDASVPGKAALCQHVARVVLRLDDDEKIESLFAEADTAHAVAAAASRAPAPRTITSALWMEKGI